MNVTTYNVSFSNGRDSIVSVPVGTETTTLISNLKSIMGDEYVSGKALVSGPLSELSSELLNFFSTIFSTHTNIEIYVPTKAEEAELEGKSIMKCPHGVNTLREILRNTDNGMYFGKFQIISVGGGDAKLHIYFVDDGSIYHVESRPFVTKLGTKRMNAEGVAELVSYTESGLPTFLMASIGYGVSTIVRAGSADEFLCDESDENTRNAVAAVRALVPHYNANSNVWVIPRRIYGSDMLPLNMLGGLQAAVKIDAGTATWKVELPNGKVSKIPVNTSQIVAEIAQGYEWAFNV